MYGFFTNLFTSVGQRDFGEALSVVEPVISDVMNCQLTASICDEEIKGAIFQLGALKSPGPDGFPGFFYQTYWDTMGDQVCKAVKSFFLGGHLLKELNQANLVLLPKVANPVKLSHFRPISLCNFSMKIITKILANRLKKILKGLISPNQSAFVPGRLIQDNIIVAHEAFHFLKLQKKGSLGHMAVKLDFNKAYDRVEWDFLSTLLQKMGFHTVWIRWVMECVTTVTFSIFANGEKRASIIPTRGLRQGDPLSSYLFILVADVLSKLLTRSLRNNLLSGFKLARHCPTLSHLFFADDVLLFLKANVEECTHMLAILKIYCEASGQLVNFEKSSVQFSANTPATVSSSICNAAGLSVSHPNSKSLGLPSFWGRSKAEAYEYLIERILSKLQGWKQNLLSQAGKEILIKAVVQAIPSYAMACFAFPKKFCDKLNAYIRNFWWRGDPEGKGINWLNWGHMTLPNHQGGMGFRDFNSFNLALLARQVNDGAAINFWDDKWIPSIPGFKVLSSKPTESGIQHVQDVIDAHSTSWRIESLTNLVSEVEVEAIRLIPIAMDNSADSLVWHFEAKGEYSVRSGNSTALTKVSRGISSPPSSSFQPPKNFWKLLWALKVPPKLKNFWWWVCKNGLATKVNLYRRRCAPSNLCPICQEFPETIEHLLFGCDWVRAVWFGCDLKFPIVEGPSCSVLRCSCNLLEQLHSVHEWENLLIFVVWIGWYIWKARNNLVFNHHPIEPSSTLYRARVVKEEFDSATAPGAVRQHQSLLDCLPRVADWQAPSTGSFKINCMWLSKRVLIRLQLQYFCEMIGRQHRCQAPIFAPAGRTRSRKRRDSEALAYNPANPPITLPAIHFGTKVTVASTADKIGRKPAIVEDLLANIPGVMMVQSSSSSSQSKPKPKRVKKAKTKATVTQIDSKDTVPISKLAEVEKNQIPAEKRLAEADASDCQPSKRPRSD
ncbi:uncharacterized protein LOC114256459 [Camellia sinensis]|uniref:uncharacterized protein LOC114256459 n=1 Tax=Camellia sinensis TaxID=4442 RepID=UPI00103658D5|nr:uncharacterized protein LOC114256459 [Camellia sinensis]